MYTIQLIHRSDVLFEKQYREQEGVSMLGVVIDFMKSTGSNIPLRRIMSKVGADINVILNGTVIYQLSMKNLTQ